MKRHFYSLRFRLFLLILLTILPLATVMGGNIVSARRSAIQNIENELLDLSRSILHQQDNLIQDTRILFTDLSSSPDLHPDDPEACSAFLEELQAQNPQYTTILLATSEGNVFCSGVLSDPVNLADREYFQHTLQRGDFVVGKYIIGRLTGKPLLPLAYPVLDHGGNVAYVLAVGLDLDWLDQLIQLAALPPGSTVTLLDREATILARAPNADNLVGQTVPESALFQAILEQQGDGMLDGPGLDGTPRLYAFAPLVAVGEDVDVYLALGIPRDVAYAEADHLQRSAWLALGFAIVLGGGMAALVGERGIVRRIHALGIAAQRLGEGDLSARSGITRGLSEARWLAGIFDEMAASLQKSQRALLTLSECNQALVKASSEDELLHEICRIVVEIGGYRLAWVGIAEQDEAKNVRPVAKWGFEEGYLENIKITWGEDPWGSGPTGTAIRTGEPAVSQNSWRNPSYTLWREQAQAHGYASSIALPLTMPQSPTIATGTEKRVFGVLNIYAAETDAFDPQELELLNELADDLAYGIAALRARAERQRAEQALRDREAKTRLIVEENADGILVLDHKSRVLFANPAVERIFMRPIEALLGRDFGFSVISGGIAEIEVIRSGGGFATLEVRAAPFEWEGSAATLVSLRDISQRVAMEKRTQRLLDQQLAISQLALALGEFQEVETIYERVYQHVHGLMDASTFIISLFDPEEQLIRAGYVNHEGQSLDAASMPSIPLAKAGRGTQSQVIRSGQPFYAPDYRSALRQTDTEYTIAGNGSVRDGPPPEDTTKEWSNSALFAPMKVKGQTIGVIQVQSYRRDAYDQEDIDLLCALANVTAIAINNVQLLRETRQEALKFQSLYQIAMDLSLEHHLDPLLGQIVKSALKLLDVPAGLLYLLDAKSNQLEAVICLGSHVPPGDRVRPGEGVTGQVMQTHQPLIVDDYQAWEGRITRIDNRAVGAVLAVPLLYAGELVGVLLLHTLRDQERSFSRTDMHNLELLAGQAAGAVTNMRALVDARRRLAQIEALRQIDRAITGSVDLRVTQRVLLKQITTQLSIDAAAILLLNPHSQILDYSFGLGFHTQSLQHTHLKLGESYAGRAAMEQRLIHIPDLRARQTDFLRSPHFSSEGFVTYFGVPLIAKGEVRGVLELFHRKAIDPDTEWLQFMDALATHTAIAIDNAALFDGLKKTNIDLVLAYDHTLEGWAEAVTLRDWETGEHTRRVTDMTLRLAQTLGIGEEELMHVRRGAVLHDVGKLGIPDRILNKPGPLDEDEWEIMRQHPIHARDLLAPIDYLRPALDIPYCHHEKWDGTGYPRGLKGEDIPLAARIFAVVDVWDALSSDRPYREAWPLENVMEYIQEQAGKHFDPEIVGIFLELFTDRLC